MLSRRLLVSQDLQVGQVLSTDDKVVDQAHDEVRNGYPTAALLDRQRVEPTADSQLVSEVGDELKAGERCDRVGGCKVLDSSKLMREFHLTSAPGFGEKVLLSPPFYQDWSTFSCLYIDRHSVSHAVTRGSGLSGLDVMSSGNAASGIVMSHARLELEGCRIHDSDGGLAGGGALRAAAGSEVVCRDVEFLRNTGVTGAVSVTSGSQRAYFDGCLFRDNETRLVLNDAGALEVAASVTELVDCVFYRNRSIAGSVGTVGAVHYYGSDGGSLLIDNCLIVANEGEHHGAILAEFGDEVTIRNSTIASNVGQTASGLTHIAPTVTTIKNCIFASNGPGPALLCGLAGAGPITVTCSDIWGNGEGPECVGGSNIFLDPRFCGIDRWELLADSPCAPSVNPACGLIGAREVACLTHVQSMSWRKLKSLMLDK